ncbi:lysozyme-like domain containing protein [Halospina sp. K52047b]|uniref:transglycosylase SLT domain-containing protein n=1 Tax=Halospina sp. K52047b TaxID=2614160 RepID=UPI001249FC77|nr:lysozyme-like domain containing protein [Halospina sp. K52047b]KAA8981342.1 lysozyme-like domain containing protein [Halospina sp. K52047b]
MAAVLRCLLLVIAAGVLAGCSLLAPDPPVDQDDLCEIFREQPEWYDYARASEERWGTPIATQMAFIYRESSFRSHVRPPRPWLLGIIPWFRSSSAYGYAQAQDPVWGEYEEDAGGLFARRTHMKHATDFIGWYNRRSHERQGIALSNPEHLYLAYHQGPTGYERGSYRSKPGIQRIARQVEQRTWRYDAQLKQCESEFRCRHFWQFWPFCSE